MSYLLQAVRALYEYVALYVLVALLGVICLSWSVIALLLYPLPRRQGIAAGRFGIMAGFRLYSWLLRLSGAYRLDLRELDALCGGPPVGSEFANHSVMHLRVANSRSTSDGSFKKSIAMSFPGIVSQLRLRR